LNTPLKQGVNEMRLPSVQKLRCAIETKMNIALEFFSRVSLGLRP